MTETTKRGGTLEETRLALERWRRAHGGRGKPIPLALWRQAAGVARAHGVGVTARALRVSPAKLARLAAAPAVDAPAATRVTAAPGFVALGGLRVSASREAGVVLELVHHDGARMRVEVTGDACGVELATIARAFWSRGA